MKVGFQDRRRAILIQADVLIAICAICGAKGEQKNGECSPLCAERYRL
jgi:hypothetical protein